MTRRELLAITPGLLLLNCSSDPTTKNEATKKASEKAPEPVTGLHALFQMYTYARSWTPDLKVIQLSSRAVPEVKAVPGKAAAWQAQFASESLVKTRSYTFSVYEESVTLRQGIFADSPGPLSSDMHSFVIGDASTDSDKAWELAAGHSQKYSAEHPDMPISYILEADRQTNGPVWRVIWGTSAASSSYSILIDAHTGTYIRTLF